MTMRLSKSSFTGTARTVVAVGSSREAFMFFATAAEGPGTVTSWGPVGASATGWACLGAAGAAAGFAAAGAAGLAGAGAAAGFGAAGAGAAGAGGAAAWA